MAEAARRIESPEDVEAVLRSGVGSFREYVECAAVGRKAKRWDLVDVVGERALERQLGLRRREIPKITEAAQIIATAYLGRAQTLADLPTAIDDAERRFGAYASRLDRAGVDTSALLDPTRYWLEELRLLLSDATVPSYTKLCSKLRNIDRADLGVEAASRALELDPQSDVAYNTRAAAKLDMGNVPGASGDVRRAWKLNPSSFVAATFSRVLMAEGDLEAAIDKAREGYRLDPSPGTARGLLAAAAAANDDAAVAEAQEYLQNAPADRDREDMPDYWIQLLAADALIDAGRLDEAERHIRALLDDPDAPQGRTKQARNKLRNRLRTQQGRFEFGAVNVEE